MSTSEPSVSTSAPQTASAASSVQPPANTARRAKSCCSGSSAGRGSRRSWRGAFAGVRARRAHPGQQRQPLLEPLEQCAGGSTLMRAAASSIASGSPSSRAQIARRRSGGRRRARGRRAGRTGAPPRLLRAAAPVLALGADPERLATGREEIDAGRLGRKLRDHRRHLGRSCSRLSSTSNSAASAVVAQNVARSPVDTFADPNVVRSPAMMCSSSVTVARAMNHMPRKHPQTPVVCITSRVLPLPPGP